jgi:hypothetical protein
MKRRALLFSCDSDRSEIQAALDRAGDQGLQFEQLARVSSTLRLISDGRFQMADFQR